MNGNNYDPKILARAPKFGEGGAVVRKYGVDLNDERLKTCTFLFRNLPWLKDTVSQITVFPIKMSKKYYDEDSSINDKSGNKFYTVKLPYYQMRCYGKIEGIDQDGSVTVNYEDEMLVFQVGIRTKNKGITVQTYEMFQEENRHNKLWQKTTSTQQIDDLKTSEVSNNLAEQAVSFLEDYCPGTNDAEKTTYAKNLVQDIRNASDDAWDFSKTIAKITLAVKSGNFFPKKFKKGYYNSSEIKNLGYEILFEGTEYDRNLLDEYTEDSALASIISASKIFNPAEGRVGGGVRRRPPLRLKKIDVKYRCDNINDVRNVDDEFLVFYEENEKFYCFDINKIIRNFSNRDYNNPNSGLQFSREFITKIQKIYNTRKSLVISSGVSESGSSSGYSVFDEEEEEQNVINGKQDTNFEILLARVRDEIDKLEIEGEKCQGCNRGVGRSGIYTLNSNGEILKHCGRSCFDRFKND